MNLRRELSEDTLLIPCWRVRQLADQRREDAIPDRGEMHTAAMANKTTLFDQKLALDVMDRARQRTTNANLQRVA